MRIKRKHIRKHVHNKLARRIQLYFLFSVIMIGVVIYEVIVTGLNPIFALGIGLVGIFAGFFMSRMFQIFWDKKEQIITSRIDTIGGIILGVYMIFSFMRHYIIGLFIKAPLVFVVTFALVAGVMVGRALGMKKTVIKILKKQGIR